MFLKEFERYQSHYEEGAKMISIRHTHSLLNVQPIKLTIIDTIGSCDLFFNREGRLFHSVHFSLDRDFRFSLDKKIKMIYGYSRDGVLLNIMAFLQFKQEEEISGEFLNKGYTLIAENNDLISLSTFEYDEGDIWYEKEESFDQFDIEDFYSSNLNIRLHQDSGKNKIIYKTNGDIDYKYKELRKTELYLNYDNKNRVIEEKEILEKDKSVVWWKKTKYGKANNPTKEFILDKNGKKIGVYDHFPFKEGLESGYNYRSKDAKYQRDYTYVFNDKGHWIQQVCLNDGVPIRFTERTIEYY